IFTNGQGILLTTHGSGKIHLYTFANHALKPPAGPKGLIEVQGEGVNHFMIGYSYGFTRFGFIWEGEGHATYRVGQRTEEYLVSRKWQEASWLAWGDVNV
ncbi:hypothetical protein M422DRAFT_124260, partial [Sphaerobolus stellatus SS14]